uniref:BTB domain-containing protein n=1 Tax=Romanomermis culicivorax TaxID=13658 RepID=A0A915INF0_ROMCU
MSEEKTIVVKSIFLTPSVERNQALIVGDTKIYVSRELLAMHSPVLKKLFYGAVSSSLLKEIKDSELKLKEDEPITVVLPQMTVDDPNRSKISIEDFLILLANLCSYPTKSTVDETNYATLLNLATNFDIKQVEKDCKEYMHHQINNLEVGDENCIPLAFAACQNHSKSVLIRLIPFLAALDYEKLKGLTKKLLPIVSKAIYEAKMNRLAHVVAIRHKFVHSCGVCSNCKIESSQRCETCGWWCQNCSQKYGCVKDFHVAGCDKKNCLCGYDFEEDDLRKKL